MAISAYAVYTFDEPGIPTELEQMIESTYVVGARGRVGQAISGRLAERGVRVLDGPPGADLVLLCVPDRSIAAVARDLEPGPWVAHVSGATPLDALEPHVRRFSLHPLQTFTASRGSEQLDGAWAALTADDEDAETVGRWLARTLGLQPFPLDDVRRTLYHCGATMASNYLVTIHRAAASLLVGAGAPAEGLTPLMRRTIENAFELTGPIDRGDWSTVERHLGALERDAPALLEAYLALARLTAEQVGAPLGDSPPRGPSPPGTVPHVCRTIADIREALRPVRAGRVGLVPTMGALHAGHVALLEAARAECDTVVMSLFVNPMQFGEQRDLAAYPRDEAHDIGVAAAAGADFVFAPTTTEMYPAGFQTWVDVTELGSILEGAHRPGHFRAVATVCLKLFNIVEPDVAFFGQKDAQQVAVLRRMLADLDLELELHAHPTVRDADGVALSSRNARLSHAERELARSLPAALATHDPVAARRVLEEAGLEIDYVETAPFDPTVLAAAVRVGSVRLIDNVPLEGAPT